MHSEQDLIDPLEDPHEDSYVVPNGETCHNCGLAYDGGASCVRCGCGDPTESGEYCHGCGSPLPDGVECRSSICVDSSCRTYIP